MIRLADLSPLVWGLHSLAGFSLLIVFVLLARGPVARKFGARAAYALWVLPPLRLLLPPLAIPAEWTGRFTLPAVTVRHDPTAMLPTELAAPEAPPARATTEASAAFNLLDLLASFGAELMLVAVAGAVFFLARLVHNHRAFARVLAANAEPVSDDLTRRANAIARQIGLARTPRLSQSLVVSGPMVSGLAAPAVHLPAWFEADFSVAEQDAALAHEFMHVRRGDLYALQVSETLGAIFWFNPLVWIARKTFRTDMEAACDAGVLRLDGVSPRIYGATLLKAARGGRFGAAALSAGLPLNHALKERLIRMNIAATKSPKPLSTSVLALSAGLILITSACMASADPATGKSTDRTSWSDGHRTIMIEDGGTLYVDGKKVAGKRFTLLDNPFEDADMPEPPEPPQPPVPPAFPAELVGGVVMGPANSDEIRTLALEMAGDGMKIAQIAQRLALAEMRGDTAKAAALEAEINAIESGMEAREAAIEAAAEAYEARMTIWENEFEAQMETFEASFETSMEHYETTLEAQMDGASDTIEKLADECRDAKLGPGESRTLTVEHDGKSYRADCRDTPAEDEG